MFNPPVSIKELHLTFVLWKKLLGHNEGIFEDYDWQLEEYQEKCSEGIDNGSQIGRIHDVRDVHDSKVYGDSYINGDLRITYLRSGLCTTNQEMEQFEKKFNEYSKILRKKIHIDKFDINKFVSEQLNIAEELKKAENALSYQNPKDALEFYENLAHLSQQPRSLTLEGVLNDNFALEQFIGLEIAKKSNQDFNYYEKFLKKTKICGMDFLDESPEKYSKVDEILTSIDFDSNSLIYSFDKIRKKITSNEDIDNPFFAAYLIKNLKEERNAIYSKEVIDILI